MSKARGYYSNLAVSIAQGHEGRERNMLPQKVQLGFTPRGNVGLPSPTTSPLPLSYRCCFWNPHPPTTSMSWT